MYETVFRGRPSREGENASLCLLCFDNDYIGGVVCR